MPLTKSDDHSLLTEGGRPQSPDRGGQADDGSVELAVTDELDELERRASLQDHLHTPSSPGEARERSLELVWYGIGQMAEP
jgi:hypothetical protein